MKKLGALIAVVALIAIVGYTQMSTTATVQPDATTDEVADTTPTPTEEVVEAVASYTTGAIEAFSEKAYAAALADGKTVMIDFHADWCGTCEANAPHIKEAVEASSEIVAFKANYDTEKDLKKKFGIQKQSTLIKVEGNDPATATKVDEIGPGPLSVSQITRFLQG